MYSCFFMSEKIYLTYLHKIWINHKKLHKIFKDKQNYKYIFENINYTFLSKLWFNKNQSENIIKNYNNLNKEYITNTIKNLNVKIISFNEREYPLDLKNISNPPFLLYIRWNISTKPKLAIVWTRKITNYWEKIIEEFIPDLSRYFTIVSWWAAWCDSKAHIETLKNNWNTISIIWTWIDKNYPVSNTKLFNKIIDNWWAIISIFPIWEIGNPYNFPIRNEIVVWLSKWILVVEAAIKSWSLITAQLALDNWKDLFAIPWEIFKNNSKWTNLLLSNQEAKITISTNDILEEYNINKINKENETNNYPKFSNKIEEKIYNELLNWNKNIEKLSKKINIDTNKLLTNISMLEITWIIKKNNNWEYEIN